jgi:pyridinium-3,5-biscarboxylic acid mononucleotide sulfurtransferase
MTAPTEATFQPKEERLRAQLVSYDRLAIAFSGGVDSTYLLAMAQETLGNARVLALTAESPFMSRREMQRTRDLADRMGFPHRVVDLNPLEDADVLANTSERCYYCKRQVFGALVAEARRAGFTQLAHGENADDRSDYRPGHRAAVELGVIAPLDEVDLTKSEIRELSHLRGLPTWNLPAQACLATRIPYGTALDAGAMRQVELAEEFLRGQFGWQALRVRHHGVVARLEVPPENWSALLEPGAREAVVAEFTRLGFGAVALDLAGLRSGSMNRLLVSSEGEA